MIILFKLTIMLLGASLPLGLLWWHITREMRKERK